MTAGQTTPEQALTAAKTVVVALASEWEVESAPPLSPEQAKRADEAAARLRSAVLAYRATLDAVIAANEAAAKNRRLLEPSPVVLRNPRRL